MTRGSRPKLWAYPSLASDLVMLVRRTVYPASRSVCAVSAPEDAERVSMVRRMTSWGVWAPTSVRWSMAARTDPARLISMRVGAMVRTTRSAAESTAKCVPPALRSHAPVSMRRIPSGGVIWCARVLRWDREGAG